MKKKQLKKQTKKLQKQLNLMLDERYYIDIVQKVLSSDYSSAFIAEKSNISPSTISYMRNSLINIQSIKLSTAIALVNFYNQYYDNYKGEF